jgi:hypothetical protein
MSEEKLSFCLFGFFVAFAALVHISLTFDPLWPISQV